MPKSVLDELMALEEQIIQDLGLAGYKFLRNFSFTKIYLCYFGNSMKLELIFFSA